MRVYLINIGANTGHAHVARSPRFEDGSFVYAPFPERPGPDARRVPSEARPFYKGDDPHAHDDPDWERLTYGDRCTNGRAGALRSARPGDALLFWGLLWDCRGSDWSGFTGERSWALLGAMRIERVVDAEHLRSLAGEDRERAIASTHFRGGDMLASDRIFLADPTRSARFPRAVDLGVDRDDGLLYRVFTSADGAPLTRNGRPRWSSSLRSVRAVFDLERANDAERRRHEELNATINRLVDHRL